LVLFLVAPLAEGAALAHLRAELRGRLVGFIFQSFHLIPSLTAYENILTPMEIMGVNDKFGQSGTPGELVEHYGLGIAAIRSAVRKVISRKR
jgi:predicted ABC-type transport system involved in lysophospholipase L1 biosynthesis ATPase subunit